MAIKKHEHHIKYLSQSLLLEEKANPLILQILIAFFMFIILVFVIWASYMEVDEVTVAPGKIIPVEDIHKIQHLQGGVIKRVFVQNGDHVAKNTPLIELDEKDITSELRQNSLKLKSYIKKQKFLQEQVEIRSGLYKKGLNTKMSFLSLQAEESDLEGDITEISEIVDNLKRQLANLKIISPADGIVHGFSNKTQKAIIGASELIMEIIPKHRKLIAEVQISANDIGHIKKEQQVTLKFNTYDFGKYGGCIESLTNISPMTYLDSKTGRPYYKGTIELASNHLGNTDKYPIIPGMTLSAEIKTGKKTIIEYLLKPVFVSAKNALREK